MISDSLDTDKTQWPDTETIIGEYLHTFRHSKQSQATRSSCLNYFFGRKDKDGDFIVLKKDKKRNQWGKCEKKEGKYQYNKNDEILEVKYFGYNDHIFEIGKRKLMEYRDYLNQLNSISLSTKKTKWTILRSFLTHVEDFYEEEYEVIFKFPRNKDWKKIHKEPVSNADVFLTIEEIKQILAYLKRTNFKYYLIFRFYAESGLRKSGVINLNYDKVFIEERYIKTKEKNGRVVYYITEGLRDYLKIYLEERKLFNTETKAFFLSPQLKRFSVRSFNVFLKGFLEGIGIKKKVTCHVFRRSLNLLRFEMGCDDRIMRILLNHKVRSVNFNNYVKKGLDYSKFLNYFDDWNPFSAAKIQL